MITDQVLREVVLIESSRFDSQGLRTGIDDTPHKAAWRECAARLRSDPSELLRLIHNSSDRESPSRADWTRILEAAERFLAARDGR